VQRGDAALARTSVQMTGAVQTTRKCARPTSQLRIQLLCLLRIRRRNQQRHQQLKLSTAVFVYLTACRRQHQATNLRHDLRTFQQGNQHHHHQFIRQIIQQAVQPLVPRMDLLYILLKDHQLFQPYILLKDHQLFQPHIQLIIHRLYLLHVQRPTLLVAQRPTLLAAQQILPV